MAYPVNSLTSKADCDLVLEEAAEERADLEYRQTQLQRLHTMGSDRATEKSAELTGATAEYNTLTTLLASMTEGPTKKKNEREHKRLEYRIYVLNQQQATGATGVVAQFKRLYELNCITRELAENAALKSEVEARKAAL
ncbi:MULTISPECIES: hypothetical protein [Hymenobacter]|uniref:Uncharacterized protein n=1 Tax=Hymenobacter guriensis TaxID=2793065 RepID=A0ABS0KX95_9BACT|nr:MULTISPECIES: hypothetical protein [Hymenobacter]MBG8552476.1 hypothetical protein [Hymenobacter guriensis]MCR5887178.1 hypothetical protein [Hymenobacter sp. J193]